MNCIVKNSLESIDNCRSYLHYLIERNDLDGMIELFHHQIQALNFLNSCTWCKNEEWFKGFLMFPGGHHHEHSLKKSGYEETSPGFISFMWFIFRRFSEMILKG
ncbi:hypothetical protein PJ311_05925 [Bacillus sp. CLL-7-23]|uniref:Uncharacterized protein n=1 Tax=Bacillus changyiensis TaxID=3004103 RepID=A0ABT4X436_9BACI|nr:hypothetical protein [Bacillus changyiensis]MDA7026152.1 hypothetical protein [Bacillus changyiensis]